MLSLAQGRVKLAGKAEWNSQYKSAGYQAKAWECVSLAESANDPEKRADMLRFAAMWISLTKSIKGELRGAYELPPQQLAA
jgi:hypothetical protein